MCINLSLSFCHKTLIHKNASSTTGNYDTKFLMNGRKQLFQHSFFYLFMFIPWWYCCARVCFCVMIVTWQELCCFIRFTCAFNGPFPGLPRWAGTREVKPIWILLKQTVSGISWAICKSAPRSRQITTPAPHHSVFLQAGCPACRPTNSVKALKAPLSM